MNTRNLKINEVGDFFAKKTKPTIVLSGKWLRDAGFPPGSRVSVTSKVYGELTISIDRRSNQ